MASNQAKYYVLLLPAVILLSALIFFYPNLTHYVSVHSEDYVTDIETLGPEGEPITEARNLDTAIVTDRSEQNALAVSQGVSASDSDGSVNLKTMSAFLLKLHSPYLDEVEEAKSEGVCAFDEGVISPSAKLPIQFGHHWKYDADGELDYARISSLDWLGKFGDPIYAPISGTVTYVEQTKKNACGNKIIIQNDQGLISLCHAKDFVDESGAYAPGAWVEQGEVIGHIGGKCCLGQDPGNWVTPCQASGTICSDPTKPEDCQCQSVNATGNAKGPHVHLTLKEGESNLLACLR
jgi:hypothetical protein